MPKGGLKIIFIFLFFLSIGYPSDVLSFWPKKDPYYWKGAEQEKLIKFIDGESPVFFQKSKAETAEDFLREQKINFSEHDLIFPALKTKIYSGSNIIIQRSKEVEIEESDRKIKINTLAFSVGSALWENNFVLGEFDIVEPPLLSPVKNKTGVIVTRVVIKEELTKKSIDFKTVENEDDKLGWREKKIKQKGEKGERELTHKVVYHNGKEIARQLLKNEVVKEPMDEIIIRGTHMKLGKADSGQGTWYVWKNGLFAASRTLPRGSYAKVTNTENGKSVVVRINDYGPFGNERIIDLDKTAFQKIANPSQGVIGVKVERVLN